VVSEEYVQTPPFKRILNDMPKPKLALNCIGGSSATDLARMWMPGGTLVTYGGMSRKPVTIPTSLLIFQDIKLRGFWLTKWLAEHSIEQRMKMQDSLIDLIRQDKLKFMLETWPFQYFHEALQKSQEQFRERKIVLIFDEKLSEKQNDSN